MGISSARIKFDTFSVEQNTYSPGLYLPKHKDANSRISIILKGQLEERTADDCVNVSAGSLVIKPQHTEHENVFGKSDTTLLSISFHKDFDLPRELQSWQWLEHPKMVFWGIRLWSQLQKVKNEKELSAIFTGFTQHIHLLQESQKRKQPEWISNIRRSLEKNNTGKETIQELSENNSVHRVYLSRVFRKQYGISPIEFRKYVKLVALLPDLGLTNKSLAGIAFDNGFSDQSHMTRTLTGELGYTPKEFRKLVKTFERFQTFKTPDMEGDRFA